jgi:hypothetical protein
MFLALTALMLVTLAGSQLLRTLARSQRQSREHQHAIQALWLADGGLARAAARLKADKNYSGEIWRPIVTDSADANTPPAVGRVEIIVAMDETEASRRQVRVVAIFPDDSLWRVQQIRETSILLTDSGDRP